MTSTKHDPLHPIVTVLLPGMTIAQGPTVRALDPRRPNVLPIDMHGKVAVDIGGGLHAVGVPVRSLRREEATHAPPVVAVVPRGHTREEAKAIKIGGREFSSPEEAVEFLRQPKIVEAAEGLPHTERGRITEAREHDGELCGITLGLGAGMHLFAGELARQTLRESGFDIREGYPSGWWFAVFTPSWSRVYAPIHRDEAEALIGFLAGVIGGAK